MQLATEQGDPVLRGTPELYLGLSELHRERGDLEAARQHLLRGEALREQASLPGFEYLWCVAQARMKEAEGDPDGALDLIDEAERLYYRSPIPDVRPIAALKARAWVARGRLAEAMGWVRERGLSDDDELSYLCEFEHITLARVLIARYKSDREDRSIHEATGLLERLLRAAEEGERTGSVIEIMALQALAHQALGDIPRALDPLERALTLAEPAGYIRIFVDEGEPMRDLLRQAAAGGIAGSYTRKLLSAFDEPAIFSGDHSKELSDNRPRRRKYEKSTLTPETANQYFKKLKHIMETEKPFLDSDLTLPGLAKKLSISRHHLSQIINEKAEQNYFEFVNQHRIVEAQKMIPNPANIHFNLAVIAYETGFNSLSSFNAAFKKFTHLTPSQYRNLSSK